MKISYSYILLFIFLFSIQSNGEQLYLKWTNPLNLTILNSQKDDFAPSWNRFENTLYFNSNRDGNSKFYKCKMSDSTKFNKVEMLNGEVNKTDNNVSFVTFLTDDRAYISSFNLNSYRPYFNIFEIILTQDGWSAPLPINNFITDYNTLHPTVSPDGKMLVVSSDMNSKEHKTDLYIAYRNENGDWSDLEALTVLNTDENEITPYFASNDTLFLASDGQGGPGGFDLFYSILRNNGSWTKPNPLTELNTAYDESDFTLLPGKKAVFASNRPGSKGGFDLYFTAYYLTEFKIAPEHMLEISIATQIMTLKTSDDFKFEFMPLTNSILSDAPSDIIDSIFTRHNNTLTDNNFNQIYINSFSIIGQRLYEHPGTKLFIHYNILESDDKNIKLPDTKLVALRCKEYFINTWNIRPEDIILEKHLKKLSGSELSAYPMIYLDSDKPEILNYLELGERNIEIDPPFSDIFIKIKPAENLVSWTTHLQTNKKETDFYRPSNLASDQFTISLDNYANLLRDSDSLTITVRAINKFSDTITKELHFDLIHSETKKREITIIDGIKYERVYLFIPEDKPSESSNYLTKITQTIIESAEFSKAIKIKFFSASGQERALAYTSLLKNKMNLPFLPVDIEQAPYNDELPFTRKFAPYMLCILIEKI